MIYYVFFIDGCLFGWEFKDVEVWLEIKVYVVVLLNEVRYLDGVLGMVGGLRDVVFFLLYFFLIEIFVKFGGLLKLFVEKI